MQCNSTNSVGKSCIARLRKIPYDDPLGQVWDKQTVHCSNETTNPSWCKDNNILFAKGSSRTKLVEIQSSLGKRQTLFTSVFQLAITENRARKRWNYSARRGENFEEEKALPTVTDEQPISGNMGQPMKMLK